MEMIEVDDLTPEMHLMWLVLYTYYEDVDTIAKRKTKNTSVKNIKYSKTRPIMTVYQMLDMIDDPYTECVCDMAGVNYSTFKKNWIDYVWKVLNVRI